MPSMGMHIRAIRENAGMSQQDVAQRVGVTQQAVDAWEHDISKPAAGTIELLSILFGVTPNDIYGIKTDMLPSGIYLRMAKTLEKLEMSDDDMKRLLDAYKWFRQINE